MVWSTKPSPTQAKAMLGNNNVNHYFLFNPEEVKWNISNNTVSRDTIGGRVVQLLSAKVDQMTVTGKAGSREELQRFALNMKKIMDYQIKTQAPVHFRVPSRKWDFLVYLQNVSSLGWDYSATSYPYELTLLVQEDLTGLTKKIIEGDTLSRLAQGIGYVEDFHGGYAEQALATSEAYLNTIGYLRSGGASATVGNINGTGNTVIPGGITAITSGTYVPRQFGSGGNATLTKALIAKANMNTVPQISTSRFISTIEVYTIAYWALNQLGTATKDIAIISTAISWVESGGPTFDTQAINTNATNGTAYGLWQMNEGFGTSLYDPIVSALHMAEKYFSSGWQYWGPGPDHKGTYALHLDAVRAAVGA